MQFSKKSLTRSTRFVLLLAMVACLAVGCGKKSGPDRFAVRGTVTFAGQPVPRGMVVLEPDAAQGNRGPVSVIPIIDGSYDSRELSRPGPLAGPLVARVTGYPAPDPAAEPDADPPPPLFPEFRTTVVLDPAAGPTVFDFDVPTPKRGR
jgi:hypothetical protein